MPNHHLIVLKPVSEVLYFLLPSSLEADDVPQTLSSARDTRYELLSTETQLHVPLSSSSRPILW